MRLTHILFVLLGREKSERRLNMTNAAIVPKHMAEAIVSPRAHAERVGLLSDLRWLRANNPVGLVEADGYDSFWLLTRHQDVYEVSRQNSRFRNDARPVIVVNREGEATMRAKMGKPYLVRTLLQMDEPDHLKFRQVIQSWFTTAKLKALEADIRVIAKASVNHMASLDGKCDFVPDVALTYPLRVLMKLIGIPSEDELLMLRLTQEVFGNEDEDLGRNRAKNKGGAARIKQLAEVFADLEDYFSRLTEARRQRPSNDLATAIANARIDGTPIPHFEAFCLYLIAVTAGHETTSSSTSGAIWGLGANPGELRKLQERPELTEALVDEAIRWTNPVSHFMRTATEDAELGGRPIRKGDWLMLSYLSANNDEALFDEPQRFRLDRDASRHIAFGTGAHACLGQHLARLEMRILFEELIPRLRSLELAGEPKRSASKFVGGPKTVPVRFALH
jgi:cytochrome P450